MFFPLRISDPSSRVTGIRNGSQRHFIVPTIVFRKRQTVQQGRNKWFSRRSRPKEHLGRNVAVHVDFVLMTPPRCKANTNTGPMPTMKYTGQADIEHSPVTARRLYSTHYTRLMPAHSGILYTPLSRATSTCFLGDGGFQPGKAPERWRSVCNYTRSAMSSKADPSIFGSKSSIHPLMVAMIPLYDTWPARYDEADLSAK
ncbi:hypothetical protein DFS33DRAFT_1274109 [Desarmillaria ectypa]|nr:hypothetical protein DFS33DRAFT_1274109 [Desarmillaria ectypa]